MDLITHVMQLPGQRAEHTLRHVPLELPRVFTRAIFTLSSIPTRNLMLCLQSMLKGGFTRISILRYDLWSLSMLIYWMICDALSDRMISTARQRCEIQ